MPLRKPDGTNDHDGHDVATLTGEQFPREAYAYDSDITDVVIKRVQARAVDIIEQEEWVVIDGVSKP